MIVFLLTPSTECGGIPITQSSQWQQGSEVSWRVIGNILVRFVITRRFFVMRARSWMTSILSAMNMQAARIKYSPPLNGLPPGEAEPLLPAAPGEDG